MTLLQYTDLRIHSQKLPHLSSKKWLSKKIETLVLQHKLTTTSSSWKKSDENNSHHYCKDKFSLLFETHLFINLQ